jgi:hypothetical protein
MQLPNFIDPPINIASIEGGCSRCAVVIVVASNIDDISIPWEDGNANAHCCAIAAITTVAAIAAVAAALTANNVTAIVIALASAITIAAAAANVIAAVVTATTATTAAAVGGMYQRYCWYQVRDSTPPCSAITGGGGQAVPRRQGQWQLPVRWSLSVCRGNECHVARIVMLCNNQHKQRLTWWCQLHNCWGGSDYATINIKERRQRGACCLSGKWWRDGSTGNVSSAMVGVAAMMTTATTTTTMMQRQQQQN